MMTARRDAALEQAEAAILNRVIPSPEATVPANAGLQMLLPQGSQPSFPGPTPAPPLSTAPPPATPAKPAKPRPSLPLDKQVKNPQAMQAVMAARALREQGDMQAAIENLKSADLREPNHPEILGEMALTYEEMGIASRAEPLWRQIYTMGEAAAGGYYTLASSKIGNSGAGAASTDGTSIPVPVSLGACRLSREPMAKDGEHISVQVPILAHPGATIDPSKIEIHVTIYESVNNGARVETVPPAKTAQSWSTLPLNWADPNGETAVVSYDLFTQRPGSTDTRSFHGYAVKLYYQNKLAGEEAQPESLRNAAQKGATPAGLDNALFPK
jgi:hypothetical protein